jgi:cytochrome c553
MTNFLKALIALAVLLPPIVFFVNWRVDTAIEKAVKESQITQPIAVGEMFAGKCALCHGANADGSESYPQLNKYSKEELTAKLRAHKSVAGTNPIMKMQAGSLSDAQIVAIASFISTLKPDPTARKIDTNGSAKKDAMRLDNSGGKD